MKAAKLAHLHEFDFRRIRRIQGWLAGVDESGRGPLAGPVVAAGVIFFKRDGLDGLTDSKLVGPKKRRILFWDIIKQALVGIGIVDRKVIDEINIYQATRLAMKQAVQALSHTPAALLIDGPIQLDLPLKQDSVIGGDRKSASIAAASIVAKVYRDTLMEHYHSLYPKYRFNDHKGYGTKAHKQVLKQLGPCAIHRRSFSPVSVMAVT